MTATGSRDGRSTRPFRLSCVVPAYNEAALIGRFLPALVETARNLTPDVEIIVVDDGSSDGTSAWLATQPDSADALEYPVVDDRADHFARHVPSVVSRLCACVKWFGFLVVG